MIHPIGAVIAAGRSAGRRCSDSRTPLFNLSRGLRNFVRNEATGENTVCDTENRGNFYGVSDTEIEKVGENTDFRTLEATIRSSELPKAITTQKTTGMAMKRKSRRKAFETGDGVGRCFECEVVTVGECHAFAVAEDLRAEVDGLPMDGSRLVHVMVAGVVDLRRKMAPTMVQPVAVALTHSIG